MPALIHLIYLATRNDFHEIECVTIFSGNILSWVEGVPGPTKMWFTLHKDDTTIQLTKLADRLGVEWGQHYSAITGIRFAVSEVGDMEFFGRQMQSQPF